MMRKLSTITAAILLASCGGGSSPAPRPVPSNSSFIFSYSSLQGACDNFDFPQVPVSVHYCTKMMTLAVGQILNVTFEISGDGTLVPVDSADIPPATLRLFLQRCGDTMSGAGQYQQYRYWSQSVNLVPGTHVLSIALTPENWTDVYGARGTQYPAAFQQTVSFLCGAGYTFGGQYFAGHGVSATGAVHFSLNQFSAMTPAGRHRKKVR